MFVGVKGDKVYLYKNVTKPGDTEFKFEPTGTLIGGGDIATFVNGVKAQKMNYPKRGIHANGQQISDINNYFLNKVPNPETIAYGFVVDGGIPVLVGYSTTENDEAGFPKPLMQIKGVEQQGQGPATTTGGTGGSSGAAISRIALGDGFEVNKFNLNGIGKGKLDLFIAASIKHADKMQEKYFVVITSASADKSTSIKSDNDLSTNRAITVVDYLQENLKKYGYTFEYISLGQTWGYDNGASKYKVEAAVNAGRPQNEIDELYKKSAINRKVEVVAYSKYKSMLPPNGTYTGSDKLQKF